jgi:hypothetical protein
LLHFAGVGGDELKRVAVGQPQVAYRVTWVFRPFFDVFTRTGVDVEKVSNFVKLVTGPNERRDQRRLCL